jgi:thiol-disulfide isomerase/thioredoxin
MVRLQKLVVVLAHIALTASTAPTRGVADTLLLDFTSPRCGPCRQMRPVVQRLAARGYAVREIDVERDRAVATQFHVDFTPTYVVLVDGRERARLSGAATYEQLAEMIHRAANPLSALGAADAASLATVDYTTAAQEPSLAEGPRDGRIVAIHDPFAVHAPPQRAAPAASASTATSQPSAPAAAWPHGEADATRLISATVRLSIKDPRGKSTGSGSIVDARNGMALVLTCGHLFRESGGRGNIEISLFAPGPHGAELRGTAAGELLDFDLERDLALVRFAASEAVAVTRIAPLGTQLAPGDAATCVGCDHGANPTAWSTHITSINRYQGHPNVEASRAPVEGRSGGGLFNDQGQLIGVCYLAEPQGDEGIYASLTSIHAKLDELQLSMVYQAPSATAPAGEVQRDPSQLANGPAPAPLAVRGQGPIPQSSSLSADSLAAPQQQSAAASLVSNLGPDERAALEEIAQRGARSEIICIIRPQHPEGRSEMIRLSGMSPEFVRALSAAAAAATALPGPVAAEESKR